MNNVFKTFIYYELAKVVSGVIVLVIIFVLLVMVLYWWFGR